MRADYFPEERERIKTLAWNIWRETKADWKLRCLARRFLLHIGEIPGGRYLLIWHTLLRSIYTMLLMIPFIIAILTFGELSLIILNFVTGFFVLWDALRIIKAKSVPGYIGFDGLEPIHYAALCFSLGFIGFPFILYVINRKYIKKML